ncbi:MAG: glycosyltransferase family 2 protein [Turicibacter sp.]|nr:glycosyltransferase family 2 protein [Turicibacter sp.]
MSRDNFITVFTPAYNRAHTLSRLYQSLKEQTYTDFEWILMDDGSTDGTQALVDGWLKSPPAFKLTYKVVENGGKHRAINKGLDLAAGSLFFIVDSDDYLLPQALEKVNGWEKTLTDSQRKTFAGISGNRGYDVHRLIGDTFEGEFVDCTSLERDKYRILGDKAEVWYTQVLRQNKFPEFPGEKFVTEATVWFKLADLGYKVRWFNEIIYICNYLEDGLTKNIRDVLKKNPKGLQNYQALLDDIFPRFYAREKSRLMMAFQTISKELGLGDIRCLFNGGASGCNDNQAIYKAIYNNNWPSHRYALLRYMALNLKEKGDRQKALEVLIQENPNCLDCYGVGVEMAAKDKDWARVLDMANKGLIRRTGLGQSQSASLSHEAQNLEKYKKIATHMLAQKK